MILNALWGTYAMLFTVYDGREGPLVHASKMMRR